MSVLSEFKEFAMRGNVVDLAVGLVVGGAFGKIVTSLVNDVVMPPIGLALGSIDFSKLAVQLSAEGADGKPVLLRYGLFLNNVIDFLIVAAAIFVVVKAMNMIKRRQEAAPVPLTRQEELLTQIRDSLQAKS